MLVSILLRLAAWEEETIVVKLGRVFAVVALELFGLQQVMRADAFLYANGVFTTINIPDAVSGSTVADGINDSGQIVGSVLINNVGKRAFAGSINGGFGTFADPNSNAGTLANEINNAGQIVGYSHQLGPLSDQIHGFRQDSNGVFHPVDFPGLDGDNGGTFLWSINNSGQIVGTFNFISSNNTQHLGEFLYSGGTFTQLTLPGRPFTFGNKAAGINDSGQIVSTYEDSGFTPHAFLIAAGVLTPIEVPGSTGDVANGINDLGQIVGWYWDTHGRMHGFLDTNGIFTTIDAPGGPSINTQLYDINDSGEIVGTSSLTPPPAVPEPASFLLVGVGLAGIAAIRRERRTQI